MPTAPPCLAAYLDGQGITSIAVGMGDSLGSPATITATAQHSPSKHHGSPGRHCR